MHKEKLKLSATALKKSLEERNILITNDDAVDIVIDIGVADVGEVRDKLSEDKSLWAEIYSYKIAKKENINQLFTYHTIKRLEQYLLEDLFFKHHHITIPHVAELHLKTNPTTKEKRITIEEQLTPVRDKIDDIVRSKQLETELKAKKARERRNKRRGNLRNAEQI